MHYSWNIKHIFIYKLWEKYLNLILNFKLESINDQSATKLILTLQYEIFHQRNFAGISQEHRERGE